MQPTPSCCALALRLHSPHSVDASVMLLLLRVARAAPLRHARTTAASDPSNWTPLAAAAALLLATQTKAEEDELENVVNWSGTHACLCKVKTPESRKEAIQILSLIHISEPTRPY